MTRHQTILFITWFAAVLGLALSNPFLPYGLVLNCLIAFVWSTAYVFIARREKQYRLQWRIVVVVLTLQIFVANTIMFALKPTVANPLGYAGVAGWGGPPCHRKNIGYYGYQAGVFAEVRYSACEGLLAGGGESYYFVFVGRTESGEKANLRLRYAVIDEKESGTPRLRWIDRNTLLVQLPPTAVDIRRYNEMDTNVKVEIKGD